MEFNQYKLGVNLTRFRDEKGAGLDSYLEQAVIDTDVLRTKVNKRMGELEELLKAVSEAEEKFGKPY